MSKNTKYNILLICEGENTEPSYFGTLRDIIIEDDSIWTEGINVVIKPTPKLDIEVAQESEHKTKRKKRVLLEEIKPIDRKEIEEQYRAEPVRFVREGQLELEEGTFDEVWVVFDFDNRQHTEAAFELSKSPINGKRVNIAFSNVSFEYWILVHFEKINNEFEKSECRIGDTILNCNSGTHNEDCFGGNCVGGYLRNKEYITFSTKSKESIYPYLEERLSIAYHNASWLRAQFNKANTGENEQKYWNGPYTNVDLLVKRLLQDEGKIIWFDLNETQEVENIDVTYINNGNNLINVIITNKKNHSILINANCINLEDTNHNYLIVGERKVIAANSQEVFEVNTETNDDFTPRFISVKINNTKLIGEI